MPKEFDRMKRLNVAVARHVARIVQHDLKDPRLGMVTISAVSISRDLAFGTVYITVLDEELRESTLKVLNEASRFIRHLLAKTVELRRVPQLRFVYDHAIARGERISALIDEMTAQLPEPSGPEKQ